MVPHTQSHEYFLRNNCGRTGKVFFLNESVVDKHIHT